MKEQNKFGITSIIFSIIAIIFSWNKDFFLAAIIFGAIAITFAYLSGYINQIKENTDKINNLVKEKNLDKRLIKIETKLKI